MHSNIIKLSLNVGNKLDNKTLFKNCNKQVQLNKIHNIHQRNLHSLAYETIFGVGHN